MTKQEYSILEYLAPDARGRCPGTISGREIRTVLSIRGIRFYLAMYRLEDYRLVKCHIRRSEVDGWLHWYEITAAGRMALELERQERALTQGTEKG